uniref:Uncharacterized protein n=1 Tax=Rhizophora mucronata TaxID=61149 RepID=A0A2P2QAD9_RHIMU
MHLIKALRPDGMSTLFYQSFLLIISADVLYTILNILNNGRTLKNLNHTFICLILKVSVLETYKDTGLFSAKH